MAKFPFPYTPSPSNVTELFQRIQTISVPTTKVNASYLKLIGFKSSYDTYLVSVLKLLGFVSSDGTPSDKWKSYVVKKTSRSVMASAIKGTYSELFGIQADVHKKGESQLFDFFKEKTGASTKDTDLMAQTFKNLCALAEFEAVSVEDSPSEVTQLPPSREEVASKVKIAPSLQLNIEIHIAADTPDDKIETIFKNMRKYLLSSE